MALKIWYQSMGRTDAWTSYRAHLQTLIDGVRSADTFVEVHGTRNGIAEQYRYLEHLVVGEIVENLHRAMEQKFDAFLIGNFYDPALQICREIASIPVLGLGETSCHIACLMGASFAIVAPNEKGSVRIRENVLRLRLENRLHGVSTVGADRILSLRQAFENQDALNDFIKLFQEVCAAHVAAGAEVVIPGGGLLMAALDLAKINVTANGSPIVNGIAGLIKMGEAMAHLNKLSGGMFVSKRLSNRPPSPDMIEEIRASYGPEVYPTVRGR